MSLSTHQLLGDSTPFLDHIFQYLSLKKVEVTSYELDHICYRVETEERYQYLKKKLIDLGELLTESQIGGRAIASIKLRKPILYKSRKIWLIELPAPKKGSFYQEGFEHVEFVINVPFEDFLKAHSHLNFLTKDLKKSVNQGVTLKETDFSVKFHHHTLEYVIRYLD
ncbi:MAG: VOC family protein [Saprospiraceae bacterium]